MTVLDMAPGHFSNAKPLSIKIAASPLVFSSNTLKIHLKSCLTLQMASPLTSDFYKATGALCHRTSVVSVVGKSLGNTLKVQRIFF